MDVSDVSDNPPKFLRPIYLEQIPENKPKVRISVVVNIQISRVDSVSGVPEWSLYTLQHGL